MTPITSIVTWFKRLRRKGKQKIISQLHLLLPIVPASLRWNLWDEAVRWKHLQYEIPSDGLFRILKNACKWIYCSEFLKFRLNVWLRPVRIFKGLMLSLHQSNNYFYITKWCRAFYAYPNSNKFHIGISKSSI